jgi:hypothetical protein
MTYKTGEEERYSMPNLPLEGFSRALRLDFLLCQADGLPAFRFSHGRGISRLQIASQRLKRKALRVL